MSILLPILSFCLLTTVTFGQTTFRVTQDVASFDIAGGMVENSAGDLVFAGTNSNFIPFFGNVVKMNSSGTVQWAKSYTGGIASSITDIKTVSTGGYIVTGTSSNGGAILIRIDENGNTLWSKRYQCPDFAGKPSSEYGNAVIESSDGGFVVAGGVDYFWDGVSGSTVDTSSALGFKVNSAGTLQWSRIFTVSVTNPDEHYFNDVAESADGYVFVGITSEGSGTLSSDGDYPRNALIAKTTTAGATTYINRWGQGNTSSQGLNCITRLSTGNLVIGGYDDVHGTITRIQGTGGAVTVQYGRRLSGAAFPPVSVIIQDISEHSDGTYGIIGTRIEALSFAFYTFAAKFNPATNTFAFNRGYLPIGLSAILPEGGVATDQGYYMVMTDQQAGGFNYNVIRTDNTGQLGGAAGCTVNNITQATAGSTPTIQAITTSQFTNATESSFTPVVTNVTVTPTVHCITTPCTPPAAATTVTATPSTICAGQSTSITASGPASGVTYNVYTASSGGTNLGATPLSVSPTTTTTYYVETVVTASPSCVSTTRTPVTVTVNPVPTATPGSNSPVCEGQTINLTSPTVGSATYAWTGPNSFNSTAEDPSIPSATAANAGTYTLVVTENGCSSTPANVSVVVNPVPVASASSNSPVCAGATINLSGNNVPSATYSWTGPNSFNSTSEDPSIPLATASNAGVYSFTITSGGCTSTPATTTVTVNPSPTASAGSNSPVCEGQTINLTSTTVGSATYAWTGPNGFNSTAEDPTIPFATSAEAGTYTLVVTENGCSSAPANVSVTVNPVPVANVSSNSPVCEGGSINLSSNNIPSATYAWTGPNGFNSTAEDPTISPATAADAGTYSLTITNGGCSSTAATTSVTVNALPTATAGSNSPVCEGSDILLTSSGGTSYSWTGPNSYTNATQNPTITNSTSAENGNYIVTVTDANGCQNTAQTTVTVVAGETISATATDITCNGDNNGTATAVTSGAGPYTYSWSPSGGTGATATGLSPGTYTVTVTASGCSSTATATVNEPSAIGLSTSSTASSCTTPTGTATVVATGGTGSYSYSWSPSGGTGATTTPVSAGSYTVTVTDGNGCQETATVIVSSINGPSVSISATTDISCAGLTDGSATASASGGTPGYSYSWSPSGGTAATASNLGTGTYTVTVTDAAGCTASANATINGASAISIAETITSSTCGNADGSISVVASGGTPGYSYAWTPTGNTASISNIPGGNYSVTVTDADGCSATENYTVIPTGSLDVAVTPFATTILAGETVQLSAEVTPPVVGATYEWTPTTNLSCSDCPDPIASPTETTTYTVTVTSPDGCEGTASGVVTIDIICGDYFLPTIFSPDGNLNNDELCLYGSCFTSVSLKIYDRWGELVFETTDQSKCWDGTYKDQPMNAASYVYTLDLILQDGTTVSKKGNVTLVR